MDQISDCCFNNLHFFLFCFGCQYEWELETAMESRAVCRICGLPVECACYGRLNYNIGNPPVRNWERMRQWHHWAELCKSWPVTRHTFRWRLGAVFERSSRSKFLSNHGNVRLTSVCKSLLPHILHYFFTEQRIRSIFSLDKRALRCTIHWWALFISGKIATASNARNLISSVQKTWNKSILEPVTITLTDKQKQHY